jgi:hypothetical protein
MVGAPAFYAGEGALERPVKEPRLRSCAFPDFLCSLVAPPRFLRLSLTKAAYAVASSAAYRKSGFSAGKAKPHESLPEKTAEENPSAA